MSSIADRIYAAASAFRSPEDYTTPNIREEDSIERDLVKGTAMGAADTVTDRNPNQKIQGYHDFANKALDSDVYGGRKISYFNKFDRNQQLETINPRIGVGLMKLGWKLRGSEYRLFCDKSSGISREAEVSILQDSNALTTNLELQNWFSAAGRLLARDGNVPLLNSADARFGIGEGITTLDAMPMSHTTFLPIDAEPMTAYQNEEQLWEYGTLVGGVTQVIMNERMQAKREIHYVENGRVTLIRLMHHGYQCRDIYNRQTIGIYGISLMDLLDPTIKKLEDINWGFSKAIGRYGFGRLHIDSTLFADLIKNKLLTVKNALKMMVNEQNVMNRLEPNRDILTFGKTVQQIPGGLESATAVIAFKESLEKDLSYGLCETEAGSNKSKGSTFASANISDLDAIRVLEAMRMQLKVGFEGIYKRHLELLGYNDDEAGSIRIELQPISTPVADLQILLNIAAMDPHVLSIGQALEIVGLHVPPRETVDYEEDQTLETDDETPPAVQVGKGAATLKPITVFGSTITPLKGESYKAAYERTSKKTFAAAVKEWKKEHHKESDKKIRVEDRSIFGNHIMVAATQTDREAFEQQTGRNYDDAASNWDKETRYLEELKAKK